jgi:hypothetical protein
MQMKLPLDKMSGVTLQAPPPTSQAAAQRPASTR